MIRPDWIVLLFACFMFGILAGFLIFSELDIYFGAVTYEGCLAANPGYDCAIGYVKYRAWKAQKP